MDASLNLGRVHRDTFFNEKTLKDINYFYIHLHKTNVASRGESVDLTAKYDEQRNQVRAALKRDYVNLLQKTINIKGVQVLSDVMDLQEDKVLSELNKGIKEKLQETLDVPALQKLHENIHQTDISNILNEAVKNKDKVEGVKGLEEVFKVIDNCLSLFGDAGADIGAALLASLSNAKNFSMVGEKLNEKLSKYSFQNEGATIEQQSLKKAVQQLENLAYVLQRGYFKSNEKTPLTAKGLTSLITNNLVSTAIAQGLAICSSQKARTIVAKEIKLVGTNTVKVYSDDQYDPGKYSGKTDIAIHGMEMSLQVSDNNERSLDLVLDVGISSKFYTGQGFNSTATKKVGIYSSGSGGSLAQAIKTIWSGYNQRYLIYNWISHQMYTEQINSLLTMRQLVRLFSSAGAEDFANFMIVNGKVISVWDLIQYALNNDLFKSRSMQGSSKQGITLTIAGRKEIIEANQEIPVDTSVKALKTKMLAAWQRSRNINAKIDSARIKAELHLNNLITALAKMS